MKSKETNYEKKLEKAVLYDEILTVIIENRFTEWSEVYKFYQGKPEYILLLSNCPAIIREVLKSNWRKQNPTGRVVKVKVF